MRSLWISLILFALLCGVIVINSIYVNTVCKMLIERVESLDISSAECEKELDEFIDEYERHAPYLSISAMIGKPEAIELQIVALFEYYHANDATEFYKTASQLRLLLSDIMRPEQLHLHNII